MGITRIEERFLDTPQDAVLIYQLQPNGRPDLLFAPFSTLKMAPSKNNYQAVYTEPVICDKPIDVVLERIFDRFNIYRPADYTGFSLSVSDVVALKHDGKISCYYCDSIGFRELDGFMFSNNATEF